MDLEYDIVGCFFGIHRGWIDPNGVGPSYHWPMDKFQNAVTAAVEDRA